MAAGHSTPTEFDPQIAVSYIGGADHPPSDGRFLALENPANQSSNGRVHIGNDSDVAAAVKIAAAAQRKWAKVPATQKAALLWAWADIIDENATVLAELDTSAAGRTIGDSLRDVGAASRWPRYWGGMVDKITGSQVPISDGMIAYTRREPVGICGIILPWNAPATMFVARTSAALGCGNAVIAKPSEFTPQSALAMARMWAQIGGDPGLINIITGDASTGRAVVDHPAIGSINFTGSVAAGRDINQVAAKWFKKVVLELGGKAPVIVFPDVDLDVVAEAVSWGVFSNAGQICTAGTRLLVHRDIATEFVEKVAAAAGRIRIGDPASRETQLGPLVNAKQFERVQGYVNLGKQEGATSVDIVDHQGLPESGYFFKPTIFDNVRPDMRIAQEEIFGPVLVVIPFEDEEELCAIANGVSYGLSATVWTNDLGRMFRLSERIDAGSIYGNVPRAGHPGLAFGGFKDSGVGNAYADGAIEGNTRTKAVIIRFDDNIALPSWPNP